MSDIHAAMVGFDITPRFHPQYGAWGTSPMVTELDMPLLARCLALRQDDRCILWFGSDLCGETVADTQRMCAEVADAVSIDVGNVYWSTSQGKGRSVVQPVPAG